MKKITEKTRAGKILWQKTATGATAYVPGALRMNFVDAPWAGLLFANSKRWVIFAVRDEVGNELLKVENKSSAVPGSDPLAGSEGTVPLLTNLYALMYAGDPLVGAVTELHNLAISQGVKEGVERAIDILDKM